MDSMRSLNTSLPSAHSPRRPTTQPPEQLLQAFKAAALSVTNLYKTAAADQIQAHSEGYQQALEDLLEFLDKQNIGLGDGEGWTIRQWATERYQGGPSGPSGTDSEEDTEEEKRARSSSPVAPPKPAREPLIQNHLSRAVSPVRSESAPPATHEPASKLQPPEETPQPSFTFGSNQPFTFTPNHAYPSTHDMEMELPDPANIHVQSAMRRADRHSRSSRHNGQNQRGNPMGSNNRAPTPLGALGAGAGTKRRQPFNDYFDISGLVNGKDWLSGGTKRSRLS